MIAPPPNASPPVSLANARLVLDDRVIIGRVTMENGEIMEVAETPVVPGGAIDCEGDYVIPGLVELHTDNLERHIEPRPKVEWPHAPAILAHDAQLAGCGITTVFDAMRVGSIPDGIRRYPRYARALSRELLSLCNQGALKISHFLHLRAEVCSETLIEELAEFGTDDRVGIVSLMDHTPGQRQFRDLDKFKAYVGGKTGMSPDDLNRHIVQLTELRAHSGDTLEKATVAEAARFNAVLASHDDTTTAQVETSAAYGIRLAEFPTTIAAAEACREHGIAIMMGAPNIVRGGSHSNNVSALDLAKRGLLDIVSSDYVPAALLLSAFQLAKLWDDLPRAIATITSAPANAAGLTDRGQLKTGFRGDVVRLSEVGDNFALRGVWSGGKRVS